MKELRLTFTDDEFKKLVKARESTTYKSWRVFILNKCSNGHSVKKELNNG